MSIVIPRHPFRRKHKENLGVLWASVRLQLQALFAWSPLLRSPWTLKWSSILTATGASLEGWGVCAVPKLPHFWPPHGGVGCRSLLSRTSFQRRRRLRTAFWNLSFVMEFAIVVASSCVSFLVSCARDPPIHCLDTDTSFLSDKQVVLSLPNLGKIGLQRERSSAESGAQEKSVDTAGWKRFSFSRR